MAKRIRISNETLNCYGTWIRTEGIDLTQFNRNPVLLWMHQRGVVIGMIKDIRVADGEVTGEPWFDEVREESRLAKQQWEKGTLRMGSPNFEILETSEDAALLKPGQTRPTVTRCKLMEYSMVDIGGNDDNIRLSYEGREIRLDAGDGCDLPLLKESFNENQTLQTMNEQLKTIALMLGLADTATLQEVQKQINVLLGYQAANTSLRTEKEKLEKELDTLRCSLYRAGKESRPGKPETDLRSHARHGKAVDGVEPRYLADGNRRLEKTERSSVRGTEADAKERPAAVPQAVQGRIRCGLSGT